MKRQAVAKPGQFRTPAAGSPLTRASPQPVPGLKREFLQRIGNRAMASLTVAGPHFGNFYAQYLLGRGLSRS